MPCAKRKDDQKNTIFLVFQDLEDKHVAKAIRIRRTGGPEVLAMEESLYENALALMLGD